MPKTHAFGAILARIRREQGFDSAHSFYKGRGGRRTLGLTYRNYLNLEQGRSLPKPERLEAILAALGLPEHSDGSRELAQTYLAALGLEALARRLGTTTAAPSAPEGWKLGALAAKRAVEISKVNLSVGQWKLLAEDFEAHTCHNILTHSHHGGTPAQLARMSGLSADKVKRAVGRLVKVGLAKSAGGRVECALPETAAIQAPPKIPEMVGVLSAMDQHARRWQEEGKPVHVRTTFARMSQANVEEFRRHVDELMRLIFLYGDHAEDAPDSAIYMTRAQIFRLFPK